MHNHADTQFCPKDMKPGNLYVAGKPKRPSHWHMPLLLLSVVWPSCSQPTLSDGVCLCECVLVCWCACACTQKNMRACPNSARAFWYMALHRRGPWFTVQSWGRARGGRGGGGRRSRTQFVVQHLYDLHKTTICLLILLTLQCSPIG